MYDLYICAIISIYIYIYISLTIYIPHIWYLSKLFVREAWSIEREVLSSNPFLCGQLQRAAPSSGPIVSGIVAGSTGPSLVEDTKRECCPTASHTR